MFIPLSLILKKIFPFILFMLSNLFWYRIQLGKTINVILYFEFGLPVHTVIVVLNVASCLNIHISTCMYLTLDCSLSIGAYTHKFSDFFYISEWCCLFIISL